MRSHILDDGVDLDGELEIFAREPTAVVRCKGKFHAIVDVENFGVVVGFVGQGGNAIDERDGRIEGLTLDGALDFMSDLYPFGRKRQSLSDISFAQFWCWHETPRLSVV